MTRSSSSSITGGKSTLIVVSECRLVELTYADWPGSNPDKSTRTQVQMSVYTVSGKKGATLFLPVTLRNANRFSKFFYRHTLR